MPRWASYRRGTTRSAIARSHHGVASAEECLFDERRSVEYECHPLVAELGRAGEPFHSLERRAERLDDDILLSDELVHHQPETPHSHRNDDGVRTRLGLAHAGQGEEL